MLSSACAGQHRVCRIIKTLRGQACFGEGPVIRRATLQQDLPEPSTFQMTSFARPRGVTAVERTHPLQAFCGHYSQRWSGPQVTMTRLVVRSSKSSISSTTLVITIYSTSPHLCWMLTNHSPQEHGHVRSN